MDWMLSDERMKTILKHNRLHDPPSFPGAIARAQYHQIREWLGGKCPHTDTGQRRRCDICWYEFSQGG